MYNFYFDHCFYISCLNFITAKILELFTIMFWKCRYYTPRTSFSNSKSGNVNKGHSPVGSGNDLRSQISFGSARVVPEFDAKDPI